MNEHYDLVAINELTKALDRTKPRSADSGETEKALIEMGGNDVINAMSSSLFYSRSSAVREAAVRVMGQIGGPVVIKLLCRALYKEPEPDVLVSIITRLALVGDAEAILPLLHSSLGIELTRTGARRRLISQADVAKEALSAVDTILSTVTPLEASRKLSVALQDRDYLVRLLAAEMIGRLRVRESLPLLKDRLRTIGGENNERVREEIQIAINNIDRETSETAGRPRAIEEMPLPDGRPRVLDDPPSDLGQ